MINKTRLNEIALSLRDKKISYKKLFQYINKIAEIIQIRNKKIAIYAENSLEWIYSFYAGWLNNCIVIPIDYGSSIEDVAHILSDCEPDLLITTKALHKKLSEANVGKSVNILHLEDIDYEQNIENVRMDFNAEENDTAIIIYTSGTTGKPKGVMLSFLNLQININAVTIENKIITATGETLLLLPLHHVLPLAGALLATLYIGGTVVVSPSMQSKDLMDSLKNNKITVIIGVPRFYELIYISLKNKIFAKKIGKFMFYLARKVGSYKFSKKIFKKVHDGMGGHVDFMVCGGAALNQEVGNFYKTLGFQILEGYGMTEAAPMIAFTRPNRVKVGSPGELLSGIELKTIDNEIVVRGKNVMQGYYNNPEETAKVIKSGWLYTGDLGFLDDKGFLHITGRKKDIIVLPSGKNISPVEIETKLENEAEAVKEAAVFLHNEKLHTVIVPDFDYLSKEGIRDMQAYFREEILSVFNQKLSSYKRIMQFSLVKSELPRTKLGKIRRFKLAELVDAPKDEKKEEEQMQCEEYKIIKDFIEKETSSQISPSDHIEYDIAMDSLGKISLIDFIERTFGVSIDEDKLLSFPSVSSMVEHVKSKKIWQKLEVTNWTEILKEKVNLKLPKSWPTMAVAKNSAKAFFKVYFKFKGEGYKNKLPEPCIITPNHQSFFDGLFVAAFIGYKTMKSTYFYAKKKHIKNKFVNFLATRNNIIIVDLNSGLKESIQQMAEVLKKGKNVIIFPEGTRTKTGELGEFKKMFAILSKELNVPVVPVAISGAFKALPRGKKFPRPFTKIKVRFLETVYPQNYTQEALIEKVYQLINSSLTTG